MFRYKSNNKAIIIAGLIVILCLIGLTGATLALFTSKPNDGTIGVITTAGDVKVDIVDAANDDVSLVGKVLQFQTTSQNKEVVFEPGAAFYTQGFKIKNIGDIPINFRLYVSEDDSIDMQEFYEAFDIWISTSPTDLDNAQRMTEFVGRLEAGCCSTDSYYLFVKMKESAGNEFQGKIYEGIGVTVYAVQGNVDAKE